MMLNSILKSGCILLSLITGHQFKETVYDLKSTYKNVLPTEDLLFEIQANRTQCAIDCMLHDSCISMFYNDNEKVCHGYRYRIQPTTSTTSVVGYTYLEQRLDCETGYTLVGRGKICLKLLPSNYNWMNGRAICQSENADLVILDTAEKEQDLKDYVLSVGASYAWIFLGLSDRDVEGTWKWVDGTPVTDTYINWLVGAEPNSADGGFAGSRSDVDCAVTLSDLWYDRNCYRECQIVCEKEAASNV